MIVTVQPELLTSATQSTNNVGTVHSLLGTFPLSVTLFSTVLTQLVLIVSQSTVERGQFSQLISLVIVLTFGRRCGGFDDSVDQSDTGLDFSLVIRHDQTMQLIILVRCPSVGSLLSILDTSLSSDRDLGTTLPLHALQRVTTRSNKKTKEVDFGEFFDGNIDLVLGSTELSSAKDIGRRSEVGISFHRSVDQLQSLFLQLLPVSKFTGICTSTISIVHGSRGRRSLSIRRHDISSSQLFIDLLKTDVDGIIVELGLRDVTSHGGGQTSNIGSFRRITPS